MIFLRYFVIGVVLLVTSKRCSGIFENLFDSLLDPSDSGSSYWDYDDQYSDSSSDSDSYESDIWNKTTTKISLQQTIRYKINGKLNSTTSNATFITNDWSPLNEVEEEHGADVPSEVPYNFSTYPPPIPEFLSTVAAILNVPSTQSDTQTTVDPEAVNNNKPLSANEQLESPEIGSSEGTTAINNKQPDPADDVVGNSDDATADE